MYSFNCKIKLLVPLIAFEIYKTLTTNMKSYSFCKTPQRTFSYPK